MKTLVCVKPGVFAYHDRGMPVLEKDHAIIRISRIGICGTDLHAFEGKQPFFSYPRVLGHELSGTLVDFDQAPGFVKGESVTFIPYFNCGKCIACRTGKPNCCVQIKVCGVHIDGGMTEYLSVPSDTLVHGGTLTADELALLEPQSIGAHGVRRGNIKKGEFVLVIGAGPIGLGAMEFARVAGAQVIALDINPYRLSLCRDTLRIPYVLDGSCPDVAGLLQEITGGDMPSVVMDATGNLAAINQAFHYLAHGGRYVLIGLQKDPITFSHPEFHKREATLLSSRNATRADFNHVIDCMERHQVNPLGYLTHRVRFGDVKAQFGAWLDPGNHVVKVIVEMDH